MLKIKQDESHTYTRARHLQAVVIVNTGRKVKYYIGVKLVVEPQDVCVVTTSITKSFNVVCATCHYDQCAKPYDELGNERNVIKLANERRVTRLGLPFSTYRMLAYFPSESFVSNIGNLISEVLPAVPAVCQDSNHVCISLMFFNIRANLLT